MERNGDPETFFTFLSESSFWMADWVPVASVWHDHAPFAFWLMEIHRPRCLVELGVHSGLSYMAFCQSAKAHGLDTKCHAIDTWKGDQPSSFYGEEVFSAIVAHNREHYGSFSTLIRSSFDEAVDQFEDGSIDLLHIDGLHRYEAVRHDFETWLPKVSDRGIILFHDTCGHREDFGIFRLWEELKPQYPHFEFFHGHGLGILGIGKELPEALQSLFELPTDGAANHVRMAYARLGEGISRGIRADKTLQLEPHLANSTETFQKSRKGLARTVALHRKRVHFLEKNIERMQFVVQSLQERSLEYQTAMESLGLWQKSWFRRAFSRWRPIPAENHHGFFRRLELSVRKRRKRILARLRGAAETSQGGNSGKKPLTSDGPSPADETIPGDPLKHAFRVHLEAELQVFLKSETRIELECSGPPKISVLVVLYNQAAFSLLCFQCLELESEIPIELVIVDNNSTDQTDSLLERVHGANVLRNTANAGFVKGVNQAAAKARGEHLLLLNNDAVLRPNALANAVSTLESASDIAAVGGRLVLPDGTLQEAGSIIWADGSCLGYGRGLVENACEAMFRRDVDFCSAAFLLVRRSCFEAVAGLDEGFSPAYSEETDLCMRFYEQGLRVVYEPGAVIDHFEFASSVKPASAIAQQRKNIALLRSKHEKILEGHRAPSEGSIIHARSRRPAKGRILFLDDFVPLPTKGSGCPRALEILRTLDRAGFFVTLWPRRQDDVELEDAYRVLPRGIEVIGGRTLDDLRAFLMERTGYYNILIASRPQNMEEVLTVRRAAPHLLEGIKIIYDAEAVVALRDIQRAEVLGHPLPVSDAETMLRNELRLAEHADATVVVSEREATHFRQAGISNLRMVNHSLDVQPASNGFSERRGFLFVGRLTDEDSPNSDSILWFAREIFPLIQKRLGKDIDVKIVGANSGAIFKNIENASLYWLGAVEDLRSLYANSRVFIAPTRFAAGIPHKVHEAAAHGLPVVATNLLAEQLQWVSGQELLSSDDPGEFAENCIRLYTQEILWREIRSKALARVSAEQSPEVFSRSVLSLF